MHAYLALSLTQPTLILLAISISHLVHIMSLLLFRLHAPASHLSHTYTPYPLPYSSRVPHLITLALSACQVAPGCIPIFSLFVFLCWTWTYQPIVLIVARAFR